MAQILGYISQSSRNGKKPRHIASTVKSRKWSVSAGFVSVPSQRIQNCAKLPVPCAGDRTQGLCIVDY